jgi:hypothetical protein
MLECLEDRTMLSSTPVALTVTTLLDDPITLIPGQTTFSFDGGGIYNKSNGIATVTDSIFAYNSAIHGGGIYDGGKLINARNLFFHNTGGDIYPQV